jgi:hypothetical protein
MFEMPARKADTCEGKENRMFRAQFNRVNKRPSFWVTWQGILNSGPVTLPAASALSGNLLIHMLM